MPSSLTKGSHTGQTGIIKTQNISLTSAEWNNVKHTWFWQRVPHYHIPQVVFLDVYFLQSKQTPVTTFSKLSQGIQDSWRRCQWRRGLWAAYLPCFLLLVVLTDVFAMADLVSPVRFNLRNKTHFKIWSLDGFTHHKTTQMLAFAAKCWSSLKNKTTESGLSAAQTNTPEKNSLTFTQIKWRKFFF